MEVGSLLGDKEDITRIKQLTRVAVNKMTQTLFRTGKVKNSIKLKLYKTLIKVILLYASATWALTKAEEEELKAFHRNQLRRLLNIKYPVKITNES